MNKKVAIITGASDGIGKSIAVGLSNDNYHVILIARSQKNLQNVKNEIEKNGHTADLYPLDVANADSVKTTIDDIVTRFHKIDVLINNAGILKMGSSEMASTDIDEIIKVNLLGAIYVGNCVAEQMKKQKSGYIMNISSMAGKRGLAPNGIYSASKFGVTGYSESIFKELLSYGINVTAICPSTVATSMTKSFAIDQRLMIHPEDILKTVRYLLSLGENAVVPEIMVQCRTFLVKEAQALRKLLEE